MDYDQFFNLMARKGIINDPAFRDFNVRIEDTPNLNGCPLGVYFPSREVVNGKLYPAKTIIVPPDSTEWTALHELGHHHGKYYHGDLSERYADKYMMQYAHGPVMLYRGTDFTRLPKFSKIFDEGERGVLGVAFSKPLNPTDLEAFQVRFHGFGEAVPLLRYRPDPIPAIGMDFVKGVDWLTIAVAGLSALALAGIGAIAYSIYKIASEAPWVFPVAIAGGVAAAILFGIYVHKHPEFLEERG